VRRQSRHLSEYRAALEKLSAKADLSKFRSRAEIAKLVAEREANAPGRASDGVSLYPCGEVALVRRAHAMLESGAPYALRLDMAAACSRATISVA